MGRVALDANLMAAYERYYTAWQAEVKAAGYGDGVMFWAEYLGDEPDGARAAAKTYIREHKLSKLHATESDPEADAAMEAFLKKHDIEEGDDIPEHLEEEYAALDRALMADWFPPEKRTNIAVICTSGVTEFYAPATEAADTPGSTKADEPAVDPGLTEAAKARLEEIRRHCAAAALAGKPELTMYLLHDALVVRRHYGLSTIHSTSERINDAHLLFSSLAPIEEPSGKPAESKRDRNHDLSLAVGNAIVLRSPWIDIIDPDIRKYWTPDEAWLNTLKKTELVTIGEEIGAKDAFNWASSKKAMVEFLAYAFSGTIPTEYGRSIGDIHAAAKTWLPAYFRRNES